MNRLLPNIALVDFELRRINYEIIVVHAYNERPIIESVNVPTLQTF